MTVVLHLSDPHFGTEQTAVVEALLKLAHAQPLALAILSGDITQRARRHQFEAAGRFMQQLPAPARLVIPGNHDISLFNLPARLLHPYAGYRRAFGNDLEPVFENAALLAIGVNTTRRYRHVDGEISAAQIERVAARLHRASAQQLRIVVTHQPVCVTRPEDEKNLLHGHQQAIRRWAEAGADLVLGGHIHLPYVCALRESHAGLPRELWAVQAGTALSARVRHGTANSVNLIHYDGSQSPRSCTVERWDYSATQGRFVMGARHQLRCGV